ncbi:unnamed protein product, partial [Trypanosoma congolense IL3000]
FQQLL